MKKKKEKENHWLHNYTPEKKFSAPVCWEKNIPAQGKIPAAPPYLMVAPLSLPTSQAASAAKVYTSPQYVDNPVPYYV